MCKSYLVGGMIVCDALEVASEYDKHIRARETTQPRMSAAVMTALKRTPTWDEAKKVLGEAGFMERLLRFDKDTLDDALLKRLGKFTNNKDFSPESVGKVSGAVKGMCLWVHAMKVRHALVAADARNVVADDTAHAPSLCTLLAHANMLFTFCMLCGIAYSLPAVLSAMLTLPV